MQRHALRRTFFWHGMSLFIYPGTEDLPSLIWWTHCHIQNAINQSFYSDKFLWSQDNHRCITIFRYQVVSYVGDTFWRTVWFKDKISFYKPMFYISVSLNLKSLMHCCIVGLKSWSFCESWSMCVNHDTPDLFLVTVRNIIRCFFTDIALDLAVI